MKTPRTPILIAISLSLVCAAVAGVMLTQAGLAPVNEGGVATPLLDGRQLLSGGLEQGKSGRSLAIWDPATRSLEAVPSGMQLGRRDHTALRLRDGRVVIAGGTPSASALEVFDPARGLSQLASGRLEVSAQTTIARLELGRRDKALYYTPSSGNFTRLDPDKLELQTIPATITIGSSGDVLETANGVILVAKGGINQAYAYPTATSLQIDIGTVHVTKALNPDGLLIARFADNLEIGSVNPSSVQLLGANGAVANQMFVAGGRVLIRPMVALTPGAQYGLFVKGVRAKSGVEMPIYNAEFGVRSLIASQPLPAPRKGFVSTKLNTGHIAGYTASRLGFQWAKTKPWQRGAWVPSSANMYGQWATNFPLEEGQAVLPSAPAGVTALAGEVRRVDGTPLAGVRLTIGERSVLSDARGQFVLRSTDAGRQTLEVDGDDGRNGHFGSYVIGVNLEPGRTINLPQTIWLNPIDEGAMVDLPSPTTQEMVITHPNMPGFELRIPKGTVIRGRDGKIVTRIGLTPLPVDRAPFAMPVVTPTYFTIQPGGARIETVAGERSLGAQIVYPNYNGLNPGEKANFYNYDPGGRNWFVYGMGTVTADARQIVPDRGVSILEFAGAMFYQGPTGPPAPPKAGPPGGNGPEDPGPPGGPKEGGPSPNDGDPVDMSTGLFMHNKTDLSLGGVIPISVSRTYRQGDPTTRAFGRGWSMGYNIYMLGTNNSYQNVSLVLANGTSVPYVRTSPGTGYADAVFSHTGTPSAYSNTTITFVGGGWQLLMRDGSSIYFPSFSPATKFCGRDGQCIEIARQGDAIRKITAPGGRFISFTLDGVNRVTEAKDHSGRKVTYTYDNEGLLWKATYPDNTTEEYTYNALGDIETLKNRRGIVILRNQYNPDGRVSRQTDATGGIYEYFYTVGSSMVTASRHTDPRANSNDRTFSSKGYTTSVTVASGSSVAQSSSTPRSASTNIVISGTTNAVGSPADRTIEYVRDANGNVIETKILGMGGVLISSTKLERGAFELVTKVTDPLNKDTRFEYDAKGRLVKTIDSLNRSSSVTYDALSRPLTSTDARGKVTTMAYSGLDLSRVTDPLGRSINAVTDILGRTIRTTDPLGNSVSIVYDSMDRVTKVTDPKGQTVLYEYDAVGNLTKLTETRGKTFLFEYDGRNRLTKRTDPRAKTELFEYDQMDNMTKYTDKKGQITTLEYDGLNRVSNVFHSDNTYTSYVYDYRSRVFTVTEGLRSSQSPSATVQMDYDTLNRLIKETVNDLTVLPTQAREILYEYDLLGRRTKMTAGAQPPVTYTYNDSSQLLSMTQGSSVTGFTYNAASGLLEKMALPNGISQNYNFDDAGQLTSITYRSAANAVIGDLQYTYDAAGRRTKINGSFARTNLPSVVSSAVYDDYNRLTAWNGQGITYDENGNMLSDGSRTYTWDTRDRLKTISGSSTASFKYDAVGRRLTKTINGATTSYQYDGDNIIGEFSATNAPTAAVSSLGVDGWLSRTEGATSRQFLTDALGSVIATTDSSGALKTQYTYEPYGRTTSTGEASSNPFKYTGREDDGTGLYYYRARYYNPSFQRFISSDPIGLSGGLNTYQYANGDPISFTDPSGNTPCWALAAYSGAMVNMGIQLYQLTTNYVTNGAEHGDKMTYNWGETLISGGSAALGCTGAALGGAGITSPVAQSAIGNAFGNAAGSAVSQLVDNGCISGTQLLREGAYGFATGTLGSAVSGFGKTITRATQPGYVADMRFYYQAPHAIVRSNGGKVARWLNNGNNLSDLTGGATGAAPYIFDRSECRSYKAQK